MIWPVNMHSGGHFHRTSAKLQKRKFLKLAGSSLLEVEEGGGGQHDGESTVDPSRFCQGHFVSLEKE